jgi:hypothetical protein
MRSRTESDQIAVRDPNFFRSISLPFYNRGIVDTAMKTKRRPWTPEQHRRYIETLGPHLPGILRSLSYLILATAAAIGLIANNSVASAWITNLITRLR